MARFQDMTIDQFREIRAKAGGLVIRLPEDTAQLSLEEKQVGKLMSNSKDEGLRN